MRKKTKRPVKKPVHEHSCIEHSRWGCFDADYEGTDDCPICERRIALIAANWNDGSYPFHIDSRSKICCDCYCVVKEIEQFSPVMLVKFLKKARKWTAIKRHAKK